MSKIANSVTIVHRRDRFRAEEILVKRIESLIEQENVHVLWDHVVEEIFGDEHGMTAIALRDLRKSEVRQISARGMFVAIGQRPNTDLFEGQLKMSRGYIVTMTNDKSNITATSIPGVFAAEMCKIQCIDKW